MTSSFKVFFAWHHESFAEFKFFHAQRIITFYGAQSQTAFLQQRKIYLLCMIDS